jgi:hypothetical protein
VLQAVEDAQRRVNELLTHEAKEVAHAGA